MMQLQPLGDKVVLKQEEVKDTTESGLYIPESSVDKPNIGIILETGLGRFENGNLIPMQTKVGDKVLFGKYTGTEIEIEKEKYIIVSEPDILAIIK